MISMIKPLLDLVLSVVFYAHCDIIKQIINQQTRGDQAWNFGIFIMKRKKKQVGQ